MYKSWWKIVFLVSLICTQWAHCFSLAHSRLGFHRRCNISYPPVTYAQLECTLTYPLSVPFDYYPVTLPVCQPAMPKLRPSLEKTGCCSTSTCLQFILELSAGELKDRTVVRMCFTRYNNIKYNYLHTLCRIMPCNVCLISNNCLISCP